MANKENWKINTHIKHVSEQLVVQGDMKNQNAGEREKSHKTYSHFKQFPNKSWRTPGNLF